MGFTNPVGTGGVCDVCLCLGCGGIGGVSGWVAWSSVWEGVAVVVRLPKPMEGNEVTSIFRSLQNCQFHHRRLESLEHFNVLYIYIYILF